MLDDTAANEAAAAAAAASSLPPTRRPGALQRLLPLLAGKHLYLPPARPQRHLLFWVVGWLTSPKADANYTSVLELE